MVISWVLSLWLFMIRFSPIQNVAEFKIFLWFFSNVSYCDEFLGSVSLISPVDTCFKPYRLKSRDARFISGGSLTRDRKEEGKCNKKRRWMFFNDNPRKLFYLPTNLGRRKILYTINRLVLGFICMRKPQFRLGLMISYRKSRPHRDLLLESSVDRSKARTPLGNVF